MAHAHGSDSTGRAGLDPRVAALLRDADLSRAVEEADRSLIRLAIDRSLSERLRAGVAYARLAARLKP